MQDSQIGRISNFIWSVADESLRDNFTRGKYRDVILPMTVIRRMDAVLEPTKQAVLERKKMLEDLGILGAGQDGQLKEAAGQQFYNDSPFTLRDIVRTNAPQQLESDFVAYLDGFSQNVQDILDNFDFRHQDTPPQPCGGARRRHTEIPVPRDQPFATPDLGRRRFDSPAGTRQSRYGHDL